jgi:hypothetical protein
MSTLLLEPPVQEIEQSEAEHMIDAAAKRYLNMSGPEFVQAWKNGHFEPNPDARPGVMRVAGLLPLLEQF